MTGCDVVRAGDGVHGAVLGALTAADAGIGLNGEANQLLTDTGGTALLHDVGDVLIPEIPQGGQNRVGRGLPQSTQGGGLDVVGKLLQAVYIFKLAVAGNNLVQDLE